MTIDPARAVEVLSNVYGVSISEDEARDAIVELESYSELSFGTLRGMYKLKGDMYVLLAVENVDKGNGDWVKYIDHLKAEYPTILVQQVVNDRLRSWLLRHGFYYTKKSKRDLIWRGQDSPSDTRHWDNKVYEIDGEKYIP